jgi:uncharacterized repeat protein (TIGR03899 family)
MSNNNIIKVKGKPLEKLFGVIKKGLGSGNNNTEIKKESNFNTDDSESSTSNFHPDKRIQERLIFKETKRQQNLDYINFIAAEQLTQEESVSEEPVEEDWIKRFFNIAEDISNEEMQSLWGRILAGEVKQPNSYSLRTLEILKNLSKHEAEIFMKFASLAINSNGSTFVLNFKNEKLLEEEFGLNFNDRLLLEEIGFLTANDLQFRILATQAQKSQLVFILGKSLVLLEKPAKQPEQQLQILVFTKIGQELIKLVNSSPKMEYIKLLASKLRKDGYSIKHGIVLKELPNGSVNHSPLFEVPLTDAELKVKKDKEEKDSKN